MILEELTHNLFRARMLCDKLRGRSLLRNDAVCSHHVTNCGDAVCSVKTQFAPLGYSLPRYVTNCGDAVCSVRSQFTP